MARLFRSLLVVGVFGLVGGSSAQAAFPARDGEIAFTYFSQRISPYNGGGQDQGIAAARVGHSRRDLRSCHRTFAGETAGTDGSSGDCSISYGKPSFSPNGDSLVFSTYPRMAIMDPDGRHFRLLPQQTAADVAPAFSPQGGRLVFEGQRAGARPDLFVVDVAGGHLRRLTYRGGSEPAWSSSGLIAFVRSGQIYVVGRRGGLKRVTGRGGAAPSWSPSGHSITFVRNRDVYVMRADGTGLRRLTRHHIAADSGVVFSPSGKRLAFGRYGAETEVEIIDLQGRRRGKIDTPSDSYQGTAPDWQPLR